MRIINERQGRIAISDDSKFLDDDGKPIPIEVRKAVITLEAQEIVRADLECFVERIEIDVDNVRWIAPNLSDFGEIAEIRFRDGRGIEFAEGSGQPTIFTPDDAVESEKPVAIKLVVPDNKA